MSVGCEWKRIQSKDTADSKISIEGSIKEWNVKMKIVNQTGKKLQIQDRQENLCYLREF